MNISLLECHRPLIVKAAVTSDSLIVEMNDGRSLSAPLAWFPRLFHSSPGERKKWRLIADGVGVHWEDIDEDISIDGLLAGRGSNESQTSLEKWLATRQRTQKRRPGETKTKASA